MVIKRLLSWLNGFRLKLGKWFWVLLVVFAVIIWRIIAGSNTSVKVEATKVAKGELVESVSTSGTVRADEYSTLTFPAGGKIAWVKVKAGDEVTKGQAIAGLDTVPLNAIYQQALNTRRSTQAAVDNIHDELKNKGSAESFDEKSTRTTAEVANDNAWDAVLAAKNNLDNASIFAPFKGIMDTVSPSSPGMSVVAATANYTIVNPDTVYFDAEVVETDLPHIKVGQTVNIKLDAYPDEEFTGTVESIGMVAFTSSTGGNAYHVRITLPENADMKFKIGMDGDADIVYNTLSNALKVPAFSIVSDTNNYVWIIDGGRAKKANVEIGGSSIDETEITSGLTEGQTVISQPPANLKEGQKVSI